MNIEKLKEALAQILGDSCPHEPFLELFSKLDKEGLAPYGIASSMGLVSFALMFYEDKENHGEFVEFMKKLADNADETYKKSLEDNA